MTGISQHPDTESAAPASLGLKNTDKLQKKQDKDRVKRDKKLLKENTKQLKKSKDS